MINTVDLAPNEPHPSAIDAMEWVQENYDIDDLIRWREVLANLALDNNRLAEVCVETCRRLIEGEPVSDRYLLGLAWVMRREAPETPPDA